VVGRSVNIPPASSFSQGACNAREPGFIYRRAFGQVRDSQYCPDVNAISKALIEAIVYLVVAEGSDDRQDDDLKALERVFAELGQATTTEVEDLLKIVRAELEATGDPTRIDALEAIIAFLCEDEDQY